MKAWTLIALVVLATGLSLVRPSEAAAKRCGGIAFTPNTEDGVYAIRARATNCRTARRVARRARKLSITRGPYRYRARGFRCRGRLAGEGLPRVKWRCRRGAARVRFIRA